MQSISATLAAGSVLTPSATRRPLNVAAEQAATCHEDAVTISGNPASPAAAERAPEPPPPASHPEPHAPEPSLASHPEPQAACQPEPQSDNFGRLLADQLRATLVPEIRRLGAGLEGDATVGGVPARSLRALMTHSDPLVKRLAGLALEQHDAGSVLANDQLRRGRGPGALHFVQGLGRELEEPSFDLELPEQDAPDHAIRAIEQEAKANGLPTTDQLKTLSHLPHRLHALDNLQRRPPNVPAGDARLGTWSSHAVDVLQGWWGDGLIEVFENGRRRFPGDVDLSTLLTEHRAAVNGRRVSVRTAEVPHSVSEAAKERAAEIAGKCDMFFDDYEHSPGMKILDDLVAQDPALATETIAALVARVDPSATRRDPLRRVEVCFKHAENHPELKPLLAPHVDALLALPQAYEAHGRLGSGHMMVAGLLDQVTKIFPERGDDPAYVKALDLLLRSGEQERQQTEFCFWRLWNARPEHVGRTVATIKSIVDDTDFLSAPTGLLERALTEYGWKPTPDDVRWAAAQACCLPAKRLGQMEHPLRLLHEMEKCSPGSVRSETLPGSGDRLQPIGRALLEHVQKCCRPQGLYREPDPRVSNMDVVRYVYSLAFPDSALVEQMLGDVEDGVRRTGDVEAVDEPTQRALAILCSLHLEGSDKDRLHAVCGPRWVASKAEELRGVDRYALQGTRDMLVDRFAIDMLKESIATLRDAPLTRDERNALLDRNEVVGRFTSFADGYVRQATLEALRSGLEKAGLERLTSDDEHLVRLYNGLLPRCHHEEKVVAAWREVDDVVRQIGPQKQDVAVEVVNYVHERIEAGEDAEAAMRRALSAVLMGHSPHDVVAPVQPGTIERRPQQVRINGISIPVRVL